MGGDEDTCGVGAVRGLKEARTWARDSGKIATSDAATTGKLTR
jgi:hypothetical protein